MIGSYQRVQMIEWIFYEIFELYFMSMVLGGQYTTQLAHIDGGPEQHRNENKI
jgi:hypothetical protein